jgi:hypothetical protein
MPVTRPTFWSTSGKPLAGGFVYTCYAGAACTSSTIGGYPSSGAQPSVTDSTGLTANPDPVVLDAYGTATIWLGPGTYKIVVENSAGVVQSSVDNVPGNGQFTTLNVPGGITTGSLTDSGPATVSSTLTVGGQARLLGGATTTTSVAGSDNSLTVPNTMFLHSYYAPLASPVFTGTPAFNGIATFNLSPIVPTAAGGSSDNSLSAANTAWVQDFFPNTATAFTYNTNPAGFQKLPSGIMIEWGTNTATTGAGDVITYTFPFATSALVVVGNDGGTGANSCSFLINAPSVKTAFSAYCKATGSSSYVTGTTFHWVAIGY